MADSTDLTFAFRDVLQMLALHSDSYARIDIPPELDLYLAAEHLVERLATCPHTKLGRIHCVCVCWLDK